MLRYADSESEIFIDHHAVKESNELQKYRFKSTYARTHSTEQPEK